MENFLKRKDRFDFFESFESPLLNITFRLETVDFLPFCKANNFPPFHFFLFHLFKSLGQSENFRYRIYEGEVIKIDDYVASYTAMGPDSLFNYTRFVNSPDMEEFIRRSIDAKKEVETKTELVNTGVELTDRELKNYVFITSLPWLDFTAIEHPIYRHKSNDIPAIAWGKFTAKDGVLSMPFSVQAHHGFVDAVHIYQLSEKIRENIRLTVG